MLPLLSLIIPALVPVGTDLVRSVVAKFTGVSGGEAKTVDESIKLMEAQTNRIKAVSDLDRPTGELSKWVSNFRAVHRYMFGDSIFLVTAICLFLPNFDKEILNILLNMSGSVFSFFFGDRLYFHLKNK